MLDISRYLKKFQLLTSNESEVSRVLVEIVFRRYGVELSSEQVKFNNKSAFINTHSILKSRIYLDKKVIIRELNERLHCVVRDIR